MSNYYENSILGEEDIDFDEMTLDEIVALCDQVTEVAKSMDAVDWTGSIERALLQGSFYHQPSQLIQ